MQARLTSFLLAGLLAAGAAGCSHTSNNANQPKADAAAQAKQQAAQQAQAATSKRDKQRQEIDQIPPPSKSLYLAVHTADNWTNPFITVRENTVTLRVIFPDTTSNAALGGELLKPAGARKHELEVRLADLPEALASLPANTWPYGRVVAIEEESTAVKRDRRQIRRNVESTIQILNDLGIVVDEWTGPNGSLLR
jgi:hypothetical protein